MIKALVLIRNRIFYFKGATIKTPVELTIPDHELSLFKACLLHSSINETDVRYQKLDSYGSPIASYVDPTFRKPIGTKTQNKDVYIEDSDKE